MKAGWKTVKLGHIGVHIKGSSMPAKESRFESWSVPSFETGQPEIVNGSSILAAKTPVEVGDVLICKINPRINRVWRITETGNNLPRICSTEWVVFRANNPSEVLPQWVQIYCSSPAFREWITGQITGTTGSHARAKPSNIFDQEIPLPPLAEQKRIVTLLDEAFASIDEIKAKTEATESAAKELKASLLKQLIEPNEADMKNGWKTVKLGDLTDLITKGTTPTSVGHDFYASGINFVKVESISPDGNFIIDRFAHISPACHEALKRSQLRPGDILFSIAGALGRTGLVTEEILPANTNQALAIIRLKSDAGLHARYLLKVLESSLVLKQIEKVSGGAAQQNLSLAQVRDIEISMPPLTKQLRIVALLDEAFAEINELNKNGTTKLNGLFELKNSLLSQAFAGELTD